MNEMVGTPYYVAPEVLKKSYDSKCDIWSAGIILHILLVGRPPFDGNTEKEIMLKIKGETPIDFKSILWESRSVISKDLMPKILSKFPHRRATGVQILSHEWFNSYLHKYDLE